MCIIIGDWLEANERVGGGEEGGSRLRDLRDMTHWERPLWLTVTLTASSTEGLELTSIVYERDGY